MKHTWPVSISFEAVEHQNPQLEPSSGPCSRSQANVEAVSPLKLKR